MRVFSCVVVFGDKLHYSRRERLVFSRAGGCPCFHLSVRRVRWRTLILKVCALVSLQFAIRCDF